MTLVIATRGLNDIIKRQTDVCLAKIALFIAYFLFPFYFIVGFLFVDFLRVLFLLRFLKNILFRKIFVCIYEIFFI